MSQLQLDSFGCHGNTIKVFRGHYVDLANPTPESIEIESIAWALAKTCRFGGHCPMFYSVAEHSVRASLAAYSDGLGAEVAFAVLMHDAAEAYIGDIVKPLKLMLGNKIAEIEQNLEVAIGIRFGIDWNAHKESIKRFDRLMLKAEKIKFWPMDTEQWAGFAAIELRPIFTPSWKPWSPDEAAKTFLNAAAEFVAGDMFAGC